MSLDDFDEDDGDGGGGDGGGGGGVYNHCIVMTMGTMMTIELVKMFSCGASVKVIGTSRGCQRHFRGFRGISWASNGRENAETFNLFSILRQKLLSILSISNKSQEIQCSMFFFYIGNTIAKAKIV